MSLRVYALCQRGPRGGGIKGRSQRSAQVAPPSLPPRRRRRGQRRLHRLLVLPRPAPIALTRGAGAFRPVGVAAAEPVRSTADTRDDPSSGLASPYHTASESGLVGFPPPPPPLSSLHRFANLFRPRPGLSQSIPVVLKGDA